MVHHRKKTFEEEYRSLLLESGIVKSGIFHDHCHAPSELKVIYGLLATGCTGGYSYWALSEPLIIISGVQTIFSVI